MGARDENLINPYEPPQGPLIVDPVESDTYPGPWRDGEFFVMPVDDSDECSLPARCVITGVPVRSHQILYAELKYPKSFLGINSTLLCMTWPLSRAAWPRIEWFPIVGFFSSLFVVSLWMQVFSQATLPADLAIASLTISAIAATIMIFTKIADRHLAKPFLSIVRLEMGLAWISGAHANFLRELPPRPGGGTA